jgi:ADP-ribose pyrophosphatase YjhB (NUDIX family)
MGKTLLQLPSVSVIVRDSEDRVLLVRHADMGSWTTPGGLVEPQEVPSDAAVRETWEETGLYVRLTRLAGVYGGPEFVVQYSNGDRTSYVMVAFEAVPIDGEARPDEKETVEVGFFSREELESLELLGWLPEILNDVFAGDERGAYRMPRWAPPQTA